MRGLHSTALLALMLTAGVSVAQPQYSVVNIHPSQFMQSAARGAGGGFQVGDVLDAQGNRMAAVWDGTSNVRILAPNSAFTIAYATDGVQAAGIAPGGDRALVWDLQSGAQTNLHPAAGYDGTGAYAVANGTQAGFGVTFDGMLHAVLWHGTAGSMVDLTPTMIDAVANGAGGTQQVGYGMDFVLTNGFYHALLWNGTAESTVDLHPQDPGFEHSVAQATDGLHQVGFAEGSNGRHAILWSGSSAGFVDLHPAEGYTSTIAYAVKGNRQAGAAQDMEFNLRAVTWTGTADSMVDLHAALPPGYVTSGATAINDDGSVVGWANFQDELDNITTHAVIWRIGYTIIGFLNPINDPAVTTESVFKQNRTVQFRFQLRDGGGNNVGHEEAAFSVEFVGPSNQPVNEAGTSEQADSGGLFTYDPVSQIYSYKLSTKNLPSGFRYRGVATITSTGQRKTVTFVIR